MIEKVDSDSEKSGLIPDHKTLFEEIIDDYYKKSEIN